MNYTNRNPVAYYFSKVRALELGPAHYRYLSDDAIRIYTQEIRPLYEILYDRIVNSKVSPFIKQEFEQWFVSKKDEIGKSATAPLNNELESMLRRFNFV